MQLYYCPHMRAEKYQRSVCMKKAKMVLEIVAFILVSGFILAGCKDIDDDPPSNPFPGLSTADLAGRTDLPSSKTTELEAGKKYGAMGHSGYNFNWILKAKPGETIVVNIDVMESSSLGKFSISMKTGNENYQKTTEKTVTLTDSNSLKIDYTSNMWTSTGGIQWKFGLVTAAP
jgi:hypothetical protein